ncbi:MAG: SWIM zinc finger domain-containing protein [Clostridia bacterium]|nr:SWIM zinc finger domain-containing protein [Clostridia bacterium]MDD4047596.1 SWIM zinc finger domain-containing protein [Clostridia bacterium]
MLKITEEYINAVAPNQNAIMNAWKLLKKNSFFKLNISSDETVIFGECMGSGKSNYFTSVDFANFDVPVYRCTCPSRQFPCKHILGLMYAYIEGKEFQRADIPQSIVEKRAEVTKREEKKEKENEKIKDKPKKVNKNDLLKKIQMQKEGLDLLEKIIANIVRFGLGTVNKETIQMLENQTMELGNYYIPGAQRGLREFILLFKNTDDYEKIYTKAIDRLITLYSICKKGRDYLEQRTNDPGMSFTPVSALDEWMGHVWQLSELKSLGYIQNDVELVQLSFSSYADEAREEFVDIGTWINLKNGQIQETRNYRPIKGAKYIREGDSVCSVIQLKELYLYPGDNMNTRVRWENMTNRAVKDTDYTMIKSFACRSLKKIVKSVKNQIKNFFSSKYPVALLRFARIGIVENRYILEDLEGERIVLSDMPGGFEPPSVKLLQLIRQEGFYEQVMLVRFYNDFEEGRLYAKPLSIIKDDSIIRLIY